MILQGKRPALVLVDVQRGALMPSGASGVPNTGGAATRIERIRELVSAARAADVPVVFVQEVHKRTLVDFGRELDGVETVHGLEGDEATELVEGLEPTADEYLIRKRRYSAFFQTELELVLRSYGVDTVLLVGGLTDVCIHYTAVDAHQRDYWVRVIEDCVGGSSAEAHAASLRAIEYLQREALVTSADVLAELGAKSEARRAAVPAQEVLDDAAKGE
jgi:nicotinamidase-related amidase